MIIIILFVIVSVISSRSVATPLQDRHRINDGASTSRDGHNPGQENNDQPAELHPMEICEIHNYLESVGRIIFGEDVEGEDLRTMLETRFHELEAFHDYFFSHLVMALYGSLGISNPERNKLRISFFLHQLRYMITSIIRRSCSTSFKYKFWYTYDHTADTIVGHENFIYNPDEASCLCTNYEERRRLNESFPWPTIPAHPQTFTQYAIDNMEITVFEVSQYHVIPLPLIIKFFKVWLFDYTEDFSEARANLCANTLIARLRRSIRKLLLVQLKNAGLYSQVELHEVGRPNLGSYPEMSFLEELFRRSSRWLRGNIFLGPSQRGPSDPAFGRSGDDLLEAFEYDAALIISQPHYELCLQSFNSLLQYVSSADRFRPLQRLLIGFDLFHALSMVLIEFDATPLDEAQWVQQEMLNTTYWTIARQANPQRKKRSLKDVFLKSFPNKGSLTDEVLKRRWNEFIMDAMQLTLEEGDSLSWYCDFDRLHQAYIFHEIEARKSRELPYCETFAGFLYSRISRFYEWYECNFVDRGEIGTAWCSAWRRYRAHRPVLRYYTEDIGTLMRWLVSEMELEECAPKPRVYQPLQLPRDPFRLNKKSYLDEGLCDLNTGIPSLLLKNDCHQVFGK